MLEVGCSSKVVEGLSCKYILRWEERDGGLTWQTPAGRWSANERGGGRGYCSRLLVGICLQCLHHLPTLDINLVA